MQNREKEIFDETQEKQSKLAKKVLLFTFCGIGAAFAILAVLMFYLNTVIEIPIVFLAVGLFLFALGIILHFAIPTKYDYDKYKSRMQKYGVMNMYEMSAKIIELEERIAALENKNN